MACCCLSMFFVLPSMIKKGRIVEVKDPLLETAKERLSSPTTAFEKLQGKALQATQTQTKRGRESSLNDCVALLIKKITFYHKVMFVRRFVLLYPKLLCLAQVVLGLQLRSFFLSDCETFSQCIDRSFQL